MRKKMISVIFNSIIILILLSGKSVLAYPLSYNQIKTDGKVTISTVDESLICENGCEEKIDKKMLGLGAIIVGLVVIVISDKCNNCCVTCCVIPPPNIPPTLFPPTTNPPRRDPPSRTEVPEPASGLLLLIGLGLRKGYKVCKRTMMSEMP